MRSIACLLLLAASLALGSCARAPDLIGVDNPQYPVKSAPGVTLHKVYMISTRADSEVVGVFYSEKRAPELGFASVDVSVPPTHVPGRLERPVVLPPDPRTEFAIVDPTLYASDDAFVDTINRELKGRRGAERDILFFIHGYNSTTSDAILQLGQFVEDTGFKGIPVLFAWASAGQVARYVYDLNSALIARPHLLRAGEVMGRVDASGYNIFAHSMGAFLTMEAITYGVASGEFDPDDRLLSITLASPDIDVDLFESQLAAAGPLTEDFFVLLSEDDYALNISRFLAGGVPRVGNAHAEDLSGLGVVVLDLTEIDEAGTRSHTKFLGSPDLVQLIGNGLNRSPGFENRRASELGDVIGELPIRVVAN